MRSLVEKEHVWPDLLVQLELQLTLLFVVVSTRGAGLELDIDSPLLLPAQPAAPAVTQSCSSLARDPKVLPQAALQHTAERPKRDPRGRTPEGSSRCCSRSLAQSQRGLVVFP